MCSCVIERVRIRNPWNPALLCEVEVRAFGIRECIIMVASGNLSYSMSPGREYLYDGTYIFKWFRRFVILNASIGRHAACRDPKLGV